MSRKNVLNFEPQVSWLDHTLDQLAANPAINYLAAGAPAAEPTAIAALALLAHSRVDAAQNAAAALISMQHQNVAVGVRPGETTGWPTSLAILAWTAVKNSSPHAPREDKSASIPWPKDEHIKHALSWLLANRGRPIERSENFGHNSELVGWAYAEGTHSWIEPTAMAVMALTAAGHRDHSATKEGIAVLLDRQLPGGGFNYGNTYVLGQLIRPHIQPTGIALLALAHSSPSRFQREDTSLQNASPSASVTKSTAWLRRSIGPSTTPTSLAWALLGLNAQGEELPNTNDWLAAAAQRVHSRDRSPHKLALLALAAKGWPA